MPVNKCKIWSKSAKSLITSSFCSTDPINLKPRGYALYTHKDPCLFSALHLQFNILRIKLTEYAGFSIIFKNFPKQCLFSSFWPDVPVNFPDFAQGTGILPPPKRPS